MFHPEMDAVSARELAGEACYLPPPVPVEQEKLSGNGLDTGKAEAFSNYGKRHILRLVHNHHR